MIQQSSLLHIYILHKVTNFLLSSKHFPPTEGRSVWRETMSKCFSLTASANWCFKSVFNYSASLRSTLTALNDGTVMHCWVPKARRPDRPDLVLIHGFGANSMWQWLKTARIFAPHFNVYVPDLVFFGDSFTTRSERTEAFQAQCVKRVLEANSVEKMVVVGLSYGGFVAYSMAAQFEECVERVVICCAGVCLEEKDIKEGLFPVKDVEEAAKILVPQSSEKMRELFSFTFVRPPNNALPSCFLNDFIDEMCAEFAEEKRDLIRAIAIGRKLSDLPKINQQTLIIWGDQDQIFPLELAHRLKRHLGETAELVIIKNTGHAFICENPKEFHRHLKSFLLKSAPSSVSNHTTATTQDRIHEGNGKIHQ